MDKLFIKRNQSNKVVGSATVPQGDGWVEEDIDDPDVQEFLNPTKTLPQRRRDEYAKQGLSGSEWAIAMIQRDEDNDSTMYDAMIAKRVQIKLDIA